MYGHFVPQVYQKAWHTANGKRNVLYFNKNDLSKPIDNNGGNIDNNLGIEDLYIFDQSDYSNGLIVDERKLEEYFDHEIENKWNNSLKKMNDMLSWFWNQNMRSVAIKESDIPSSLTHDLISFVVMQYFRIKKNFTEAENGIIGLILDICKEEYSKFTGVQHSKIPDLKNDPGFYNSIWKSILLNCFEKKDSVLDVVSKKLLESCSMVVFTIDNASPTLVLSDNPVIWNAYANKPIKELESGVFMPINPNTLIGILCMDSTIKKGDYIFIKANINFFKFTNYLLLKQSDNKIGFCNLDVEKQISSSFNKQNDWNSMFL